MVIDLFRGPPKPTLVDSVEALKLELDTKSGSVDDLETTQSLFQNAGLEAIQFSYLAASRTNLGVAVANKPRS